MATKTEKNVQLKINKMTKNIFDQLSAQGRGLPHHRRGGGNMILGITGGTGCGKTTLLELIREHGGLTLDCDAIYHDLLSSDRALLDAIAARFPGTVTEDGLNRKALGAIVFADPHTLKFFN